MFKSTSPTRKIRKNTTLSDCSWWSRSVSVIIITCILSSSDMVSVYVATDAVLAQSVWMSVLISLTCALMLDFLPLISGRLYHNLRYGGIHGTQRWHFILTISAFFILYFSLFAFRWAVRDLIFNNLLGGMASTTASELTSVSSVSSSAAVATVLVLSVSSLITSAMAFILGFFSEDPILNEIKNLTIEKSHLEDAISRQKALIYELKENDWGQIMLDYDRQSYEAVCSAVQYDTEYIKSLARIRLAAAMKTPEEVITVTNSQP